MKLCTCTALACKPCVRGQRQHARRYIWLPMFVVDAPVGRRTRAAQAEAERSKVRRSARQRVLYLRDVPGALWIVNSCIKTVKGYALRLHSSR